MLQQKFVGNCEIKKNIDKMYLILFQTFLMRYMTSQWILGLKFLWQNQSEYYHHK